MKNYDLTDTNKWVIDIPDTIAKSFFFDIINFLCQLFKPVDVFLEIFLIKVILIMKIRYLIDSFYQLL